MTFPPTKITCDPIEYKIDLLKHKKILKTNYLDPKLLQKQFSFKVIFSGPVVEMAFSIKLYSESLSHAKEIKNIWTYGMLTAKLPPIEF